MNLLENIRIALDSIKSNLLRASLTFMIIAFGIMALVGILTALDSIVYSMNDSFNALGANSFTISPAQSNMQSNRRGRQSKRGEPITFRQAMEFKERFGNEGIVTVNVQGTRNAVLKHGKEKTNPTVIVYGIDENFFKVGGYQLEHGRNFSATELQYGNNKVIIGKEVVDHLFGGKSLRAMGKDISVGPNKYKVVGVLESKGSSMNQSSDRLVFIPLLNCKRVYSGNRRSHEIDVGVPQGIELDDAVASATGLMRNVRRLKASEENDFRIFKSDGIIEIIKENTANLRMATIAIGLVTLLGAAIGLMNIMLVSVTERTREIGIKKAMGATRRNVLMQFLTEALVICQVGGIIGVILGILIGNIVTYLIGGSFLIPWAWIILGVVLCLIVGLASGIYPAMKASKLDPIEALRYE